MSFRYSIDKDRFLAFVEIYEAPDNDSAAGFLTSFRQDPELAPQMPVLVDASTLTEMSMTREGFSELIDILEATDTAPGEARTAIVVSKTGLAVMADLFASSVENRGLRHKFRTFYDAGDAVAWLEETEVSAL